MRDRTPWIKVLGVLWLMAGTVGLLWSGSSLVRGLLGASTQSSADSALGTLLILPWTQLVAIVVSCFLLVSGWGLLGRHRWVQTVMVPAHLLFMVYTIVVWVAAFVVQGPASPGWSSVPLVCAVSILANGGMALFLNSVGATEALSWLPLRTTPLIPLRCEFCGAPLDPRTSRCPQCEAVREVAAQEQGLVPPEAVLFSLADETRFQVKPDQTTVVGRGSTRNDVNLSNPTVSRHHAQITYEQGHYVLTALRDLNGTFVNDSMIRKRTLREGDEIRFGRARFRFELMESQSSE